MHPGVIAGETVLTVQWAVANAVGVLERRTDRW